MSYQTTYRATTTAIDVLRKEMNIACRVGLLALTAALFAENPTITSIYWTQSFDHDDFSLGTIMYTVAKVINGQTSSPQRLVAADGPSSLVQFATFLRSISYHLFRTHGANVTVTITPDGVSVS